uniref:Tripartite motif-containing protein 3 n=1 Tax=Magallana gigas TaxID=29159 RepID=K1QTR1_MAGGI
MTTSNHHDASEDFTVCPICFEQFQTPWFLPCAHTFCHRCLSAHIESSCKDCDPALGFPCPVCRAFVPAPGVMRQYPTEDWAIRFPENVFLGKKETAVLGFCVKHEKRKMEFLCKTHQTGCCSVCVVKEHKYCEGFDTLSDASDIFTDENKLKLVEELKVLLLKIETIIQNEKQNISDLDDKTDTFSKMIKKMIEEMVNRLKIQEKTYIDQLAEISKDARQKLERSLRLLEQRKMYLSHWLEKVSTASPNIKTENFLKCLKTKQVLETVEDLPLIQMNFDLSAEVSRGIVMIDSLGRLFSVKVTEHSVNFNDIQKEIVSEKIQALPASSSHADESSECVSYPIESNKTRERDTKTKKNEMLEWETKENEIRKWDTKTKEKDEVSEWDKNSEKNKIREWDTKTKKNEIREWDTKTKEKDKISEWDTKTKEKDKISEWDTQKRQEKDKISEWDTQKRQEKDKISEWDTKKRKEKDRISEWDKISEWDTKTKEKDKISEWDTKKRKEKDKIREWDKIGEWDTKTKEKDKISEWDTKKKKRKGQNQ